MCIIPNDNCKNYYMNVFLGNFLSSPFELILLSAEPLELYLRKLFLPSNFPCSKHRYSSWF